MNLKVILQSVLVTIILASNTSIVAANVSDANKITNHVVYTENKLNIVISPANPEFTIKLKSNPTTGYSWFLREYAIHLIIPVKHYFEAPNSKLMGAGGDEVWVFRAKAEAFVVPQQTTIRLVYARPWQGADDSTQLVFRVTTQTKY